MKWKAKALLVLVISTLGGCNNPFVNKYDGIEGPRSFDVPVAVDFEQLSEVRWSEFSVRFTLNVENKSGVFFLGVKNTNYQFGMTPLLNNDGDYVTVENVRKHDVQFDRERFELSNQKTELFDVGVVYLLKDTMTQQVYYVGLNDDGDGAFISPAPNIDKMINP
jgi:hypothetical protein